MPSKDNTTPLRPTQAETASAWHIYAALGQYMVNNPTLNDCPYYQEAMQDAHSHWAMLFARDAR